MGFNTSISKFNDKLLNDDENNIKEQLIGKWKWFESSGGI